MRAAVHEGRGSTESNTAHNMRCQMQLPFHGGKGPALYIGIAGTTIRGGTRRKEMRDFGLLMRTAEAGVRWELGARVMEVCVCGGGGGGAVDQK